MKIISGILKFTSVCLSLVITLLLNDRNNELKELLTLFFSLNIIGLIINSRIFFMDFKTREFFIYVSVFLFISLTFILLTDNSNLSSLVIISGFVGIAISRYLKNKTQSIIFNTQIYTYLIIILFIIIDIDILYKYYFLEVCFSLFSFFALLSLIFHLSKYEFPISMIGLIIKSYFLNPDLFFRNIGQLILFNFIPVANVVNQRLVLQLLSVFLSLPMIRNYKVNVDQVYEDFDIKSLINKTIKFNILICFLAIMFLSIASLHNFLPNILYETWLMILILIMNISIGPITLFIRRRKRENVVLIVSVLAALCLFLPFKPLETLFLISVFRVFIFFSVFQGVKNG